MSAKSASRTSSLNSLELCTNCTDAQMVDASFVNAEKLFARLNRIFDSTKYTCQYKLGHWYINNAPKKLSDDDLTRLKM